MTTAQDLLIVALDAPAAGRPAQGDLSLALAGAELLDLLEVGALVVEDARVVPSAERVTGDVLLDGASASLVRQTPYETVEDWLWRRGRGLADAYATDLEQRETPAGTRRHWLRRRSADSAPPDSPDRRRAADRWAAHEPVLVDLAEALGIEDTSGTQTAEITDDQVATVLAAVGEALTELEAVRQRRRIEEDAYDNVWRAP
ncbi:GPP34 family phosphoprotein [Streptomyces sp. NPDC005573]|uniref:GPP34 family phosphoprotein n=1 Tax=unclassified Streptomyces TaxID=2593676 RepID=UPI0033B3E28E